jgi:hypothetical protein
MEDQGLGTEYGAATTYLTPNLVLFFVAYATISAAPLSLLCVSVSASTCESLSPS